MHAFPRREFVALCGLAVAGAPSLARAQTTPGADPTKRLNGVVVGWPSAVMGVGNHIIGYPSSCPRECARSELVAVRLINRYPGELARIGWFIRVTNAEYLVPGPGNWPGRYSLGTGGQIVVEVRSSTNPGSPANARPDMTASGLLGRTAVNGPFPGSLLPSPQDGYGRSIPAAQIPADDDFTESRALRGNRELWPLLAPTRSLAVGEIIWLVYRNSDPQAQDNYVSNNNFYLYPDNDVVDPYSYDKQGPWHTPYATSYGSQDGGSSWSIRPWAQFQQDLLLWYQDGTRISAPSMGGERSGSARSLTPQRRVRMDWVQPDSITCDRFNTLLCARSGATRMRLIVRDVTRRVTVFDGALPASNIATAVPSRGGAALPWCYWQLTPAIAFVGGRRYTADLWAREGSCEISFVGRPDYKHRDGALGTAYESTNGGSSWSVRRSKQWPLSWVKTGVAVPIVTI